MAGSSGPLTVADLEMIRSSVRTKDELNQSTDLQSSSSSSAMTAKINNPDYAACHFQK